KIVGFFLMFNEKLTVLDGADITATSLSSFVLPEIEDEGFTLIHIANPNADAVDLRLELLKPDGSLRTGRPVIRRLNANAAIAESFDVLFPGVEGLRDRCVGIEAPNHRTAGSQRPIGFQKL